MDKAVWVVVALLGGCLLPVQGAFNARLAAAGSSPLHASLVSFVVGTVALAVYVLATRQTVSWAGLAAAPWYAWLGGFLGAFALTAIILTFPKLGPGFAFGLIIAGQLIASMMLEHFDVLVAEPHPISLLRIAGIALVLVGVVLIRVF